jgi:isopentenyl diphosphate isomerase/L-lactate dehydrogenase-like FMN-dependent dehydrogenase
MSPHHIHAISRRRLLQFLAASPLFAQGALAAVCIGQPYLWGLGAFGQPGVERALGILRTETRNAMQKLGAPSLGDLQPAMVRRV